jgi:hypothetical protein
MVMVLELQPKGNIHVSPHSFQEYWFYDEV